MRHPRGYTGTDLKERSHWFTSKFTSCPFAPSLEKPFVEHTGPLWLHLREYPRRNLHKEGIAFHQAKQRSSLSHHSFCANQKGSVALNASCVFWAEGITKACNRPIWNVWLDSWKIKSSSRCAFCACSILSRSNRYPHASYKLTQSYVHPWA